MEEIKRIFSNDWCGIESFLQTVLVPIFGKMEQKYDILTTDKETKEKASQAKIETIENVALFSFYGNELNVYDVQMYDKADLQHSRVGIQSIIRRYIDQFDGAIIVFHYKNVENRVWRLSYVERGITQKQSTSPKRYTYILGKNQGVRTACERFEVLLQKKESLTINDLTDAFSVESLSTEFFDKYREKYADFVEYITGTRYVKKSGKFVEEKTGRANVEFKTQFNSDDKAARDYVKKLFGRIVFLYFLQKKGWLGVDTKSNWGQGDREFMSNLWKNTIHKNNYLEHVLEPLFFSTLNERRNDDFAPKSICEEYGKKIKIPYLNGGLFERDSLDEKNIKFPEKKFNELFDFFSQYNFTIDETDPDDIKIGVDPEMLGKIFENLLEDNKDKGAFYTPKEIVQYMCKESLIAYLQEKTGYVEKDLRFFVETADVSCFKEGEKAVLLKVLLDVKVCDPAVGSGAFPMGMMNYLFACISAIEGESESRSKIKKHIVKNNIYGVDIEKGAVDIARLRFWLAIVVDEENPLPLPNLDYKIMQGNSLTESYEGIDFSRIAEKQDAQLFNETNEDIDALNQAVKGFYEPDNDIAQEKILKMLNVVKQVKETEKKAIKRGITDKIIKIISDRGYSRQNNSFIEKMRKIDVSANSEFFLWHTWFGDVFNRPSKEGFDIVIGNPPYVESRNECFSEELKDELQAHMTEVYGNQANKYFPRGADLLIFFFELSLRLITPEGISTLITQNSWLSSDYGKKFQNYILLHTDILCIFDSDFKYFENANINTVITFFRGKNFGKKVTYAKSHENVEKESFSITNGNKLYKATDIKTFISTDVLLSEYKWGFLFFSDSIFIDLLAKAKKKGSKLSENDNGFSIGQGINTTKDNLSFNKRIGYSPIFSKEDGAVYKWQNAKVFVKNSIISHDRKKPVLIMPRGIGNRYYCAYNSLNGYSASCVDIYSKKKDFNSAIQLWLFCNSSFCWLMRENSGRKNLGGGMLKAEATDMKLMPLLYNFEINDEVRDLFETANKIEISTDIRNTLDNPFHKKIDDIVSSYLCFTETEKKYITEKLISEIKARNNKSRN